MMALPFPILLMIRNGVLQAQAPIAGTIMMQNHLKPPSVHYITGMLLIRANYAPQGGTYPHAMSG